MTPDSTYRPNEERHQPILSAQEEADIKAVVDAYENFVPRQDNAFEGIFYQAPTTEDANSESSGDPNKPRQ